MAVAQFFLIRCNNAEMTKDERIYLISRGFELIKILINSFVYVAGFYFGYLSVQELSGKSTSATFAFSYFFSSDNDYAAPWVIAVLSFGYASWQRKLRLKKTEEMQGYIKELETRLDPNRSSSGLMPDGQTRLGDPFK